MLVYVLNCHDEPLMPCHPAKARILLKQGLAKVKSKLPFTIKLLFGSSGYKQDVTAGMDTGSEKLGSSAIVNGESVYEAEVELRKDVYRKMNQRASYRKSRRGRKTRYRPARWRNRAASRRKGRLAPSLRSKVESHLRERLFMERILPISHWKVELASFDTHKITNPEVNGVGYQEGDQKGYYNTKAYVLHRDGYKCLSKQKCDHSKRLEVHHIIFRCNGGSNSPSNLIVLCESCHVNLHLGHFEIKGHKPKTKHATEIGIIKSQLKKSDWEFEETFGYETKWKRECVLGLPKSHSNDALAICCEDGQIVKPSGVVYRKRHVCKGDYRQTNGKHSEKRIPTGKLFGFRKFDTVMTPKGVGYIKSKRTRGSFDILNFDSLTLYGCNVKKLKRIAARTTTLIIYNKCLI